MRKHEIERLADLDSEYNKALGANISRLLKENKMSQVQLAREVRLTESCISKFCRGHAAPGLRTVLRMSAALDVSTDELPMRAELYPKKQGEQI